MAAAFWYPINGGPWEPYSHFSASCDWLPLEIVPGSTSAWTQPRAGNALAAFSLLLSIAATAVAVAVGWWVRQSSRMSFNPISTSTL